MHKTDIIKAIAKETGLSQKDSSAAVEAFLKASTGALKKGDSVTLIGFGTFSVSKTAARTGRNPQTGEKITIKASKRVKFIKVSDEDAAHSARNISANEGMFVGYTSGAVLQAVKQYHQNGEFTPSEVIVLIFPDHGSRYMSKVYSDQWIKDQGFDLDSKSSSSHPIEVVK